MVKLREDAVPRHWSEMSVPAAIPAPGTLVRVVAEVICTRSQLIWIITANNTYSGALNFPFGQTASKMMALPMWVL